MNKIVERTRKEKINYKEIILKTLFAGTVFSVAVVAPNALKIFDFLKKKDKNRVNSYIKLKSIELIKGGYITQTKNSLYLTKKGQAELLKFSDFKPKTFRKWDGLWTIISFDFPVKRNIVRDAVRFHLKRIGFIQLQQSIWVYPFDCKELIYLLKTEWKLKDELVYIRAKYISREKKLKEYFDL